MKNVMKRLSLVIICVMMIITVSVIPSSASASLNYHFGKHGSGVGTSNIVSYAQSAKNFKSNLSGAKSSKVNGSTPNVTRWKKNGKYIDIYGSKNTGKIISYGRQ